MGVSRRKHDWAKLIEQITWEINNTNPPEGKEDWKPVVEGMKKISEARDKVLRWCRLCLPVCGLTIIAALWCVGLAPECAACCPNLALYGGLALTTVSFIVIGKLAYHTLSG